MSHGSAVATRWVVDNEPSPRYPIYTRANVGEVFPSVVMPLSWTLWGIPICEPGWRQAFANLGAFDLDEFTPGEMEVLGVFGGYCYLNVSASRIFGERTPGLSAEAVDLSFFGDQPDVPPYVARDGDRSDAHEERMGATIMRVLTTTDLPGLRDEQARIVALRDARPDLAALSDLELVQRARGIYHDHFLRLWTRHIELVYESMISSGAVAQLCEAAGRPELATVLIGGAGDVDSAELAYRLWDISRAVRSSPAATAAFEAGLDGLLDRLRAEAPDVAAAVDALLHDWGSRGPNEWEMASRTWEIDPRAPLAALDRMRLSPDSEDPRAGQAERVREREAAEPGVRGALAPAGPEVQGQFDLALTSARLFLAGRERSKTTCALMVHEARVALWELGRRMAARGVLERPEHFALLRDDELDAFVAEPETFRATIAERDALREALEVLEPPFIVAGEVPAIDGWARRDGDPAPALAAGDVLQGLPGCPGTAHGTARVVLDPTEPGDLQLGDVLVAPSTDPSWTPLFTAASAVVVDVGAPISHATIVARELGVPCVISATGATRRIPPGALVEVDGTLGTITVLET